MSKHADGFGCEKRLCSFSGLDGVTTNDDILIEILLWLPAKSLTRFKLVSKNWFSLIASHHFSHLHTLRHPKPQSSLLLRTNMSNDFFYLHSISLHAEPKLIPYLFTIPGTKILSSCNGLLLLQSDHPTKEYYVYNPTTRQSRKLSLTDNHQHTNVCALILVFDPSKSPHYKILCIRTPTPAHPSFRLSIRRCPFELYDSETLTWSTTFKTFYGIGFRVLGVPPPVRHLNFSHGVHWNNVIHWVDNHPSTHRYYDMDKNILGKLPLAQIPRHRNVESAAYRYQLQEWDGHLYQFIIISAWQWKSIAVYELQADYSKWLLLYHHGFGRFQDYLRILSFVRGDGGETSTLVFHVPGKIISYRFSDKSFQELVDLKNEPFYHKYTIQFEDRDVYRFGETLANV